MITYEYPFNERIRILLRLESLFDKIAHFSAPDGAAEHHVALRTLFEILDVAGRSDLKMDMAQELERQRQILLSYRHAPEISDSALSGTLYEIEQASAALLDLHGKFGQSLRDNDWLMSVKGRAAIPGGLCEFDLPAFHYWLHQPPEFRRAALAGWTKPMLPVLEALSIILRLLRSANSPERLQAAQGQYQRMLCGKGIVAQMARIRLPSEVNVVPEVSANRFAFSIRFTHPPGTENRARLCEQNVDFDLTFCNL
ncbi:MAG: cell division protein ZapD [Zoogloeaceae bacterium]|nr:cell division protein ZapD [Zoogloeaceae bacterium]